MKKFLLMYILKIDEEQVLHRCRESSIVLRPLTSFPCTRERLGGMRKSKKIKTVKRKSSTQVDAESDEQIGANTLTLLASLLSMTSPGYNLTPGHSMSPQQTLWEREQNNGGCNNQVLLKIIKNEMSFEQLPSNSLLMTSKIYNINDLFLNFLEDKKLRQIVKACGDYVYLKNLQMVIFTIKDNVNMDFLRSFFRVLINSDVCVEFNQRASLQDG
ncbi:hypothetical protein AK88_01530 [Plasmodium fragile]|uniref:Uncharacterized protein n=1 Tax=Plasmodium fragile TaxID=5857 RepID=A0A0D9QP20_PLAFR|nr:uncharacterized protein AK88_01530 [Plasmodium fragile]KJP88840.1 hypothetical protein AK88_01530 [Plasmodium fragile]